MIIKTIKKNKNKYTIRFIDGSKITTYEEVMLKYMIMYKKELTNKLIEIIEYENVFYDVYYKTLKLFNTKLRSKDEIIKYLNNTKLNTDDKNEIINKLIKNNLLNDSLYINVYINDSINLKRNGLNKIKNELLKKDFNEIDINNAINNVDFKQINENLEYLINKKIKLFNNLSKYKIKNKIINDCINLGYEYEEIINYLNTCTINNNGAIKKDYIKLSRKYDNDMVIKKLYSKGYNKEEINELINDY